MNSDSPALASLPILGIDVSKLSFDACLLLPAGRKSSKFTNDSSGFARLAAWLKQHHATQVLAGLEATGPYGAALLWHLHSEGHVVCQLNPRRVKDYGRSQGRRVKTDSTDASLIISYLKGSERLTPWQPPSQGLRELQALVRRRHQLIKALGAERSRLAVCSCPTIRDSIQDLIKLLRSQISAMDRAVELLVLNDAALQKSVRLLRSIDGIGPLSSVTILAEIPALSSFDRARDVAAFAGLTPALAQSGTSVKRRGHMTKEGSALLRQMLYMAALQAVKSKHNAFHKTYQEFLQRGKAKMCALGAIMHKLIRVAFGVLKHQIPFVENFAALSPA